ncbi:hypothetical protein KIW84_051414, partial [Lathyrus oleraceus]
TKSSINLKKNRNAFISVFVVFENLQKQVHPLSLTFTSPAPFPTPEFHLLQLFLYYYLNQPSLSSLNTPFILPIFHLGKTKSKRYSMKRSLSISSPTTEDRKMKKVKETEIDDKNRGLASFDENMLFEVLKHVDAKTLAMAGCVNKQWHKTAQDERLWELICTKQWANTGCGEQQLRSVVLALGGFRRLHSLYLLPLSKPQTSSSSTSTSSCSSSSSWGPIPQVIRSKPLPRLGKDEVHLSLSLLSIRYYEKMNFNNRNL